MRRLMIAAVGLSLLLGLTGCGAKPTADGDLLSRASGIPSDETLLTVEGREVEAWRYLYWLAYTCDSIQTAYDDAGTELDWDAAYEDGSLSDYARDLALSDTALYAVVETWAEERGCTLTEEDQAAMEADWEAASEAYGSEDAYLEALGQLGLDRQRARTLSQAAYLYDRLRQQACDPESAYYPSAEDLSSFSQESGYLAVDFIRVDGGDDPDAARAKAQEAFSKLNSSAAPANDFAVLAATYSDDPDRDQYPQGRTLQVGDGTLPAEAEAALLDLEEGQWSGIVEADGSFYILLRQSLDGAAAAGAWFDYQLQAAAQTAAVETTDAYDRLDVADFWETLVSARTEAADPAA